MTRPACFSQPPEGRSALTPPRIRGVSRNFNNAIIISFMHERGALIEAVLIRVSICQRGSGAAGSRDGDGALRAWRARALPESVCIFVKMLEVLVPNEIFRAERFLFLLFTASSRAGSFCRLFETIPRRPWRSAPPRNPQQSGGPVLPGSGVRNDCAPRR